MKKGTYLIFIFGAYAVLLLLINFFHFRYLTVNVVFYSTLFDALVAIAIIGIVVYTVRRLSGPESLFGLGVRQFTGAEIWLTLVCTALAGYIFAISVPTVIDRSFSIYILEKLEQRGGSISLPAMNDIVIKEYSQEHRLIDVRMTEQLKSGTLTIENNCVRLTGWGKRIVAFTRFYRTNLLPKKRVLMGEISDDLTDPFKNSAPVGDFRCQNSQSSEKSGRD